MNQAELINAIKELDNSYSKKEIELFIDNFFAALYQGLKMDGEVDLGKWGEFYSYLNQKERFIAYNPGLKDNYRRQRKPPLRDRMVVGQSPFHVPD